METKPRISSSKRKLRWSKKCWLHNISIRVKLSLTFIDLVLNKRDRNFTESLWNDCDWGRLNSNCHSGCTSGSLIVWNYGFVTAMDRVFESSQRKGTQDKWQQEYNRRVACHRGQAETAESLPHLRKVELSFVMMTQLASSGVKSPDVHSLSVLKQFYHPYRKVFFPSSFWPVCFL